RVELRVLTGHLGAVTALALSPNGNQVLSYGEDRKLKSWDAATGRETQSIDVPDDVLLLLYPAGSKHVLAWTRPQGEREDDVTHAIQQIDPTSLKTLETLADPRRKVSCLSLSADGEL